MTRISFKCPKTNLKSLFSPFSLANWFSKIFCTFICSCPDIHLFLINCYLFRFRNRLWNFSTNFYSLNNPLRLFLLVYQSFLLVPTHLPFTVQTRLWSCSTHFCSFTQGSISFYLTWFKEMIPSTWIISSFSFYYNISN